MLEHIGAYTFIEIAGVVLYVTASAALLAALFQKHGKLRRFGSILLAAGCGIHGVAIVLHTLAVMRQGNLPVSGAADTFALLAWVLVVTVLFVQLQFRLHALAATLAPVAAAFGFASMFLPTWRIPVSDKLSAFLFAGHITVLFTGMACFFLASLAGLAYLLAQHQLKAKRFGRLFNILPPLETLDHLTLRALLVGFVALTAGIATGILMAHETWQGQWTRDPKVIFSLATWCWYLGLLAVRQRAGWRGARFFVLIVIGFVFLIFTFLGASFFFRGWAHRVLVEVLPTLWTLSS